jgi:hypothetical protein
MTYPFAFVLFGIKMLHDQRDKEFMRYNLLNIYILFLRKNKKVKLSQYQSVEAHKVVRRRTFHIV